MALEIRQVQKLDQQLVMTPQLQQAIQLLQLSRLELQEMISKELQDNPALEEGTAEETENGDQPKSELPPESAEPITEPVINREPAVDKIGTLDWQEYLDTHSNSIHGSPNAKRISVFISSATWTRMATWPFRRKNSAGPQKVALRKWRKF